MRSEGVVGAVTVLLEKMCVLCVWWSLVGVVVQSVVIIMRYKWWGGGLLDVSLL